ncbi:Solute carrier family 2 [Phytophthora nicotianae]|nr:Solute carrier family 2 [Phytophthora nicotianae]
MPGTVRVTKGYGADKHEAELDSTLARIIGSDWGDRSHQPVSLPMRIYWVVFVVVLGNGLYTYFAGKDESYLVEKLKKKADEKLGVEEEENEFEQMAEGQQTSSIEVEKAELKQVATTTAPATSMLNTGIMSSPGMPFIAPGMSPQASARRPKSKTELEQQLTQLREQQKRLEKQIRSGGGVAKEELEHQVRMIDIQKEQIKRMIKRL